MRIRVSVNMADRTEVVVFFAWFVYLASVILLVNLFTLPALVRGAMAVGALLLWVAMVVLIFRSRSRRNVAAPQDAVGNDPATPRDDLTPWD